MGTKNPLKIFSFPDGGRRLRLEPVLGGSLFFEERGSAVMAGYMKTLIDCSLKIKRTSSNPKQAVLKNS